MALKLIRIRRLKQLQSDRGALGPVALGKLIGRKANQTSDLLHGRAPFGERVARSIEEHAGLPFGWLDVEDLPADLSGSPVSPPDGLLAVPALRDPFLRELPDTFGSPLHLEKGWVARFPAVSNPENLRFFQMPDDGMQPTLGRGDVLLVDVGTRKLARDGVHLLQAQDRVQVRRIRIRIDGTVEVSEDSPTHRSVENIRASDLKIAGRVLWAWTGRAV